MRSADGNVTACASVISALSKVEGMGCGALHCIESQQDHTFPLPPSHTCVGARSKRCLNDAAQELTNGSISKHGHRQKTAYTHSNPPDTKSSPPAHPTKPSQFKLISSTFSIPSFGNQEVDWSVPTAVVFGNEGLGVSSEILDMSDHHTMIPMEGFVESFNISVAAAIVLYQARLSRFRVLGRHADLTSHQKQILQAVYYLRHKVGLGRRCDS